MDELIALVQQKRQGAEARFPWRKVERNELFPLSFLHFTSSPSSPTNPLSKGILVLSLSPPSYSSSTSLNDRSTLSNQSVFSSLSLSAS